ncbi:Uncharacterised protein [Klebsiella pneumoniae]|nr:Uncharacterised protein [Klebsiella pneumoniae]
MMIGAIAYSTSGRVMVRRRVKALAPSIVAASYRSSGIACNTPVVMAKTNGKPSQVCIMISAVLVQNGSVSHAFGLMPKKDRIALLMTPKESLNIPAKTRMVTNPGTAHGKIKMVRISGLKRRSFWFTRIANNTPTVHCRVVASSVHTTVHCSTSRKVERQMERVKILIKFFSPTQSTSFAGGVWYRL